MDKPSFLDQEPPPGYIAGVGRGATGFSTRGDPTTKGKIPKRLQSNENKPNDTTGVSVDGTDRQSLDQEDKEAEELFVAIENKLASKRKDVKKSSESPIDRIPNQFADLKRSLASVTDEEWLNLPDASDITKKHKRERLQDQRNRKDYAAPDTLMNSNVNLTKLTEEREKLLARQLDANMTNSLEREGPTNKTDVNEYLSELERSTIANLDQAEQHEDLKRMRDILFSYRKADPARPEGWIASAKLEEKAHRLRTARAIIEEACQKCPRNEEVWLECIRLNASDISLCKGLTAEGLAFNPRSLPLWLKAIDLESDLFSKRRVVMKALQELPKNEKLWTLVLSFEDDQSERRRILLKAVELIPKSINLWERLVELQDYPSAKKSLNTARRHLPREYRIWILAAQIEERFGDAPVEKLVKLLSNGMNQLTSSNGNPGLAVWLHEAESLHDKPNSHRVAVAIVRAALCREDPQSTDSSLMKTVDEMADSMVKIAAYRALLHQSPMRYSIWKALRVTSENAKAMYELYTTYEELLFDHDREFKVLKENPTLSLMYSKEVWKSEQDPFRALEILDRSIKAIPDCVDFWLAKLKILCLSSRFDEARNTFLRAIQDLSDGEVLNLERLYLKYVSFLRCQGEAQKAIEFLEQKCLGRFPTCYKFYLQMGQLYQDIGQLDKMKETYNIGTKTFPHCATLWIVKAKAYEVVLNQPTKARSELDLAILKNPSEVSLFVAKIQMETRLGYSDQARLITQQALQNFPDSPELWAENIKLLPARKASMKKTVFQDALKKTNNSCQVLIEIGLSFYQDSQFMTASKWFDRACKRCPRYADAWVWAARCYKRLQRDLSHIYEQLEKYEPVYGPLWISISKDIQYQYLKPSQILDILLETY